MSLQRSYRTRLSRITQSHSGQFSHNLFGYNQLLSLLSQLTAFGDEPVTLYVRCHKLTTDRNSFRIDAHSHKTVHQTPNQLRINPGSPQKLPHFKLFTQSLITDRPQLISRSQSPPYCDHTLQTYPPFRVNPPQTYSNVHSMLRCEMKIRLNSFFRVRLFVRWKA